MLGAAFGMKGVWNHNTHYHRFVVQAVPAGATRALDVGCGEGDLLADLSPAVAEVVGIDADAAILEQAASAAPAATLVNGDFLTFPFEPASNTWTLTCAGENGVYWKPCPSRPSD